MLLIFCHGKSKFNMKFTKDSVQHLLEKHFVQKPNIVNFTVSDVVTSCPNYCSDPKRIEITYSLNDGNGNRELSVVVKYFPSDEYLSQLLSELRVFDCEIGVYDEVLPRIYQFDYREKVAPQAYYTSLQPLPILVLEDLAPLKYILPPRTPGLELDHCLLVVEKLAYLHAATFALHERDPSILPKYNQVVLRKTKMMMKFLNVSYDEVTEVCRNYPDLNKYVDKLMSAKDHIMEKIYDLHNINSNFKVLNHGDCWISNIMFHDSPNGRPDDVVLVDFQHACYSTPCLDLHYFLATSPNFNVRNQENVILNHYFKTLLKYLKKLHAKTVPKRDEFDEDFRSMSYLGFGASIFVLAVVKANELEGASLENFTSHDGGNGFRHRCFNHEGYLREIRYYLPYYEELGVFDMVNTH